MKKKYLTLCETSKIRKNENILSTQYKTLKKETQNDPNQSKRKGSIFKNKVIKKNKKQKGQIESEKN